MRVDRDAFQVAASFADNGAGVRGDLKAVVTAILTDPEARGDSKSHSPYGKLREPALYATAVARAVGTVSDGVFFPGQVSNMGQDTHFLRGPRQSIPSQGLRW